MINKTLNTNRLSSGWRKLLLTVHVVVSVSVIGADLTVIILGITGLTSGIPELVHASYLTMELLVGTALLPLGFGALLTGILLGVGTHWRLTRYYWVLAKLVLTLGAVTALVFLLRPGVNRAAAEVARIPLADLTTTGIGRFGIAVTIGPSVALFMLIITAILGIYKPWGKIQSAKDLT